jgi:exopolysaccharide production protein ExoZ
MKHRQSGKIAAIQLLRAVAAATVAVLHIAFAFADHIAGGLGLPPDDGPAGQMAVMLFFIVSGYVMVIAARGSFGQGGAALEFWQRRFIRIMPPYWLATFALIAVFLTVQPQPVPLAAVARSLALVPYWPDDGGLRPMPFLWVGWTLFYEMVFYGLFGLCIGLGRRAGIAVTAAMLCGLVLIGLMVPPANAALFAVTRPVLVMFVIGMALALWREAGRAAPGWTRIAALAALIPAMTIMPAPTNVEAMGFDYLAWCGLPAMLAAFAVLGGPLAVPAPNRVIAAGDMSYAIYLLHVPVAWFWLWFWGRLPFFDAGPWDFLISALIGTMAASWLFHRWIEAPMTAALNRLVRSPHDRQHQS